MNEWDALINGKYIATVTGDDYDEALENFKTYAIENGLDYYGYTEYTELQQLCNCAASCSCECLCGAWDDVMCDCEY